MNILSVLLLVGIVGFIVGFIMGWQLRKTLVDEIDKAFDIKED